LFAAIEADDLGRVKDALAGGSHADEMDDRSGESALAVAILVVVAGMGVVFLKPSLDVRSLELAQSEIRAHPPAV
jgi:hypothetical protein